jgi:HTH-type transcriptional regulator, competence development regulator
MAAKRGGGEKHLPLSRPARSQIERQQVTLGDELRSIRAAQRLTLRAVEEATGISNAYLSQLETGKIDRPNPNFLFKLAKVYGVPYDMLMERAGYITTTEGVSEKHRPRSLPGAALATLTDLTPEEAKELVRYLAFLRSHPGGRRSPG